MLQRQNIASSVNKIYILGTFKTDKYTKESWLVEEDPLRSAEKNDDLFCYLALLFQKSEVYIKYLGPHT